MSLAVVALGKSSFCAHLACSSLFSKTTTMLFKMLSVERAWEMSKATLQKPRQIFLTKSPVLAARVEEYFRKLQTTLKVADMTKDELANTSKRGTESAPRMVMHIQDMSSLEDYLPSSFNDLKDEHFPLFVTFEKVGCHCCL
jgi:hypothetical protein